MTPAITVHDNLGRRAFAFAPNTDPDSVLHAVVWAFRFGHVLCSSWPGWGCPATDGRYCLECGAVGYAALEELKRRRPDVT